ncbi:MAG: hypothetical protein ACQEP8_01375 [Chlamydiota bacterium]
MALLRKITLAMLLSSVQLFGATLNSNNHTIQTIGDEENNEIQIYYKPGWVTNTLYKDGIWTGNEDLDGLTNSLRVVAQVTSPKGAYAGISANQVRSAMQATLEDKGFVEEIPLNPDDILPFLHASVVIMPSGLTYAVNCSLRLVEEVTLKRDSWAKDFTWQAITWQDEKLLLTRRDRVDDDIIRVVSAMVDDFRKQFQTDKKMGGSLEKEVEQIRQEIEKDYQRMEEAVEEHNQKLSEKYREILEKEEEEELEKEQQLEQQVE